MTKKEIIKETATPAQDLFDGLTEETSSTMTVWSQQLQSDLDRAGSIKFVEGKRAKALEAVYMNFLCFGIIAVSGLIPAQLFHIQGTLRAHFPLLRFLGRHLLRSTASC